MSHIYGLKSSSALYIYFILDWVGAFYKLEYNVLCFLHISLTHTKPRMSRACSKSIQLHISIQLSTKALIIILDPTFVTLYLRTFLRPSPLFPNGLKRFANFKDHSLSFHTRLHFYNIYNIYIFYI